ncbi:hypothetical protein MLD38_016677 [Melastoma candidum]|uniref:Uncharacterized protein n=1 Tax=Melastoma candidum TaxID=119954 RepID=A0ACB9QRM7_9MYRT|nr:hypothetical protein MLD38_016677 [Melastoma candidum]
MSLLVRSLFAPIIIVAAMVFSLEFTKGEDTDILEMGCNPKAADNTQEDSISDLLEDLIANTPVNGFFQYLTGKGYYAIAGCNGVISQDECGDCLDDAENKLIIHCRDADGAQIKLVDCRLRFEQYPFSF